MTIPNIRYPGPRWTILYGSYEGCEKFALEELYRAVQGFLPYVVEVRQAQEIRAEELTGHTLILGTPENNPFLRALLHEKGLALPDHPEGFTVAGFPAPWNPERTAVVIAARRPEGVLYGVETFNARVLADQALPEKQTPERLRRALDSLGSFHIEDFPRVAERGLWTWGYVVYDYRRFLDNMARLRLNFLTLWNDVPPLNSREIIAEAHARGIRVILGFPWGWGSDYNLADAADRRAIQEAVLRHYREHIAPLAPDGIYFQTLTEHDETEMGRHSVASLACTLVNEIAAQLFEQAPTLRIHFGLHATSIRDHYPDLQPLDPRIDIVWEDGGALPYAYTPTLENRGVSFAQTLEYSQTLAALRPGAAFGMVAKGWTCLDWADEFEHHRQYLLGVRGPAYVRSRKALRQPRWEHIHALWLRYYRENAEFYHSLLEHPGSRMIVEGLVEDGPFEAKIEPSVALFAETLWNPTEAPEELLVRAHSSYFLGDLLTP